MANSSGVTTNYNKFRLLFDNRDTSRTHINRLKDAIYHNPSILENQPILVNENMEIIDGQHRFTAASELGLPIHYSLVNGLTIADARQMNVLQRKWGIEDYARSYAKAGNPNYKTFLDYAQRYPLIKMSNLMIAMGGGAKYGGGVEFRSGDFVITEDEDVVADNVNKLNEFAENAGVPLSRAYAAALLMCLKREDLGFDYERFIRKLKERPELLGRAGTTKDALLNMERVYNFHSNNPVRLYG